MRQDHCYLLRSSQSPQEVVIEGLQQVAKAIDGSLPAYVIRAIPCCFRGPSPHDRRHPIRAANDSMKPYVLDRNTARFGSRTRLTTCLSGRQTAITGSEPHLSGATGDTD